MNYSTAIFLVSDDCRAIFCTYEEDTKDKLASRVMYKTLDKTIKYGDFVVIPTDTRHKMTVVKVVQVDVEPSFDSTTEVPWIIGTVKTEDFEALKAKEAFMVDRIKSAEKRKRREDLREQLASNVGEDIKTISFTKEGGTT